MEVGLEDCYPSFVVPQQMREVWAFHVLVDSAFFVHRSLCVQLEFQVELLCLGTGYLGKCAEVQNFLTFFHQLPCSVSCFVLQFHLLALLAFLASSGEDAQRNWD